MKKEEICVLIDSEEKRLRALDILKKAGEEVWDESELLLPYRKDMFMCLDDCGNTWVQEPFIEEKVITLNQLEELLLPNCVVLTIGRLKEQAERLGFELVEKKREIKVGDFGVFWDIDNPTIIYRSTLTKVEDIEYADERGVFWDNFRHLTDEEKEQITNSW